MTQKEFEKGYVLTYNSGSQYIMVGAGSQNKNSRQELGDRTMEECCSLACSATPLIQPNPSSPSPEMLPHTMDWTLLHQLTIIKMPCRS